MNVMCRYFPCVLLWLPISLQLSRIFVSLYRGASLVQAVGEAALELAVRDKVSELEHRIGARVEPDLHL